MLIRHSIYRKSGGGVAPLTSSGKVACGTRCAPYTQQTGNTNGISRTWTTSPTARTRIGVTFGHLFLNSGNESAVSGTDIVVSAWVEYPLNTYTQLTWSGGALTKSVASLTLADSDDFALGFTIPANTDHWIWLTMVSAGGLYFNQWQNTAKGDKLNVGGAGVESAPSPTVGNIGPYSAPPLIIWTTDPNATANQLIMGDSREQGVGDFPLTNLTDVGYVQMGFTANCIPDGSVFLNISTGGSRAGNQPGTDWPTGWSCRKQAAAKFSHGHLCLGFNDLTVDGRSAATTKTALEVCTADLLALNSHMRIILPTIGPRSSSAGGGWNSLADQTNIGDPGRTDHNTNVRNGVIAGNTGGYLEIANLLDAGGLWKMGATTRGVVDGVLTAGTPGSFVSATANFTAADVGAGVACPGAGPGGTLLLTYIISVTNATTAVLGFVSTTIAAGATVTIGSPTLDGLHPTPQVARVPKNNGIPAAILLKLAA